MPVVKRPGRGADFGFADACITIIDVRQLRGAASSETSHTSCIREMSLGGEPLRCPLCTQAGEQASRGRLVQKLGSALLSAAVVLSISEVVVVPPPASADSGLEKRQAELQRRKELLAKAYAF